MMNPSANTYKKLISSFVEGKLTVPEFEAEYLDLFKYDESRSEDMYEILNPLFWAVEDFCRYPDLREEGDLDEEQLSEVANITLEKLNGLNFKKDYFISNNPQGEKKMNITQAARDKIAEHNSQK